MLYLMKIGVQISMNNKNDFDNDFNNSDNPGHKDAERLCKEYAFRMVEIPKEYKSKDPSDLFKNYGKNKYLEIMKEILKDVLWKSGNLQKDMSIMKLVIQVQFKQTILNLFK